MLTTIEVALGGGPALIARDGCARDLASLRGTWRKVVETVPALESAGAQLEATGVAQTRWYLESSVSNSGRLRALLLEIAQQRGWPFEVELSGDVDGELLAEPRVVASADRRVIGGARRWSAAVEQSSGKETAESVRWAMGKVVRRLEGCAVEGHGDGLLKSILRKVEPATRVVFSV